MRRCLVVCAALEVWSAVGCDRPLLHDLPQPPGWGGGPPGLRDVEASPNPATDGDTVTIRFAADQPIKNCTAMVSGQAAICPSPSGARCTCELIVTAAVQEGAQTIEVSASNGEATGHATGSGPLQIDRSSPAVNAGLVQIVRHGIGQDDGVSGEVGAVSETGLEYAGRRVTRVRLWADAESTTPLLELEPAADGSFAEAALPDTDGRDELTLAPARLWLSAIDVPGNESGRAIVSTGADSSGPIGDGGAITISRRGLDEPDIVQVASTAFDDGGVSALFAARVYDAESEGDLVGSGLAAVDGSVEVPVGNAGASYSRLWVSGVDKCGHESGQRVEAQNADATAPVVDGTKATFLSRPVGSTDALQGETGLTTDTQSAVREVRFYDAESGGTPVASAVPASDGSFAPQSLGDTVIDRVWLEAVDKAGNVSSRDYARHTSAVINLRGRVPLSDRESPIALYAFAADRDPRGMAPGLATLLAPQATAAEAAKAAAIDAQATAFVAGPVSEGAATEWIRVPVGSPRPRTHHAAAYDSARERLVVFGGMTNGAYNLEATGDTWEFDGVFWQRTAVSGPSARSHHVMAYDPGRGVVVLFGGDDPQSGTSDFGDTWEYDGASWTPVTTATSPPARRSAVMTYDAAVGAILLYGGSTWTLSYTDTWAYDGSDWTPLSPAASPASPTVTMTHRGSGTTVLLTNEYTERGTWEYDGATWSLLADATTSPLVGRGAAMGWDEALGKVVLFGGDSAIAWNETWELDGSVWTHVQPIPGPREGRGMAYLGDGVVVLFGGAGSDGALTGETWRYDGAAWSRAHPATDAPALINFAFAYDEERGRVVAFGGSAYGTSGTPTGETWEYDGNTWQERTTAHAPAPRNAAAMAYAGAGRVVLFGGYDPAGLWPADTWELDGEDWQEVSPSTSPSPRYNLAMAYDSQRATVVMFGGTASEGQAVAAAETWEYAQGEWTQVVPGTSPPGCAAHAMAYDSRRGKVVLLGGSDAQGNAGTWEYDGATWSEVVPAASPEGRSYHAMAYDAERHKVVLFGGRVGYTAANDTWEYDGLTWTRTVAPSAPGRRYHTLTYDRALGRLVLFGGEGTQYTEMGDTWLHEGSTFVPVPTAVNPAASVAATLAFDVARGSMLLFGGMRPTRSASNATWSIDGTRWAELSTRDPPSARLQHGMAYDSARGRIFVHGGSTEEHDNGDSETWVLEGTRWTQLVTPTSPTATYASRGSRVVYDAARDVMVLTYCDGTTWEYDGADWSEHNDAGLPVPPWPSKCSMAYDAGRGRVVLLVSNWDNDSDSHTYEYDGVSWSELAGVGPNGPSTLAYDPRRGGVVALNADITVSTTSTWELDAAGWAPVTTASLPEPRSGEALAYDPIRGRVVLWGGRGSLYHDDLLIDTWELAGSEPHARSAAQLFGVALGRGAQAADIAVTYVGSAAGSAGGVSTLGVELLIWSFASEAWVSLGTHAAAPGAAAGMRTISAAPPGAPAEYVRGDHLWLMAAPLYASDTPPGTTASELSTDYLELQVSYSIP